MTLPWQTLDCPAAASATTSRRLSSAETTSPSVPPPSRLDFRPVFRRLTTFAAVRSDRTPPTPTAHRHTACDCSTGAATAAAVPAAANRPTLPPRSLISKSSSAVPTLSTSSALPAENLAAGLGPVRPINMAGIDGLATAHTAADLLRQTVMHRVGDDDHDQIGSNSSTPPGISTPQPDPVDKRLPGILHSYFGQVRDSFRTQPKHENGPASLLSVADGLDAQNGPVRPPLQVGGQAPPTAPSSPPELTGAEDECPPLLPHERLDGPARPQFLHQHTSHCYPTPPTSSSSSMHRPRNDGAGSHGSGDGGGSSGGGGGLGPACSTDDHTACAEPVPVRMRSHTFTTTSPLANIITAPSVPAAHISNPASCPPATTLPSPTVAQLRASPRSSHTQPCTGDEKLTDEATVPSSHQATPPHTPRTRSQESSNTSSTRTSHRPSTGAPVDPPRGKLSVLISEGRGLRPSVAPYVVCQFQWSEYISEGPQSAEILAQNGAAVKEAKGGILMRRTDSSDMGRPMAIPMRSRQSSNNGTAEPREGNQGSPVTDPKWGHDAIFDVVGEHSEIDVSVYDRSNQEAFLGHIRFCPNLVEFDRPLDGWFTLESRDGDKFEPTGEVHLRIRFEKTEKKHLKPGDFQILKLIGKGTFGQVFQVRKKDTKRIYAMKVLSKKVIVQKKEVAHTLGERNILVRTAKADSPFIVGLKFSFQTPSDLYLVTDFMSGGELFWHLQREGRFHEARAKFYIAELILALEHLHKNDVVYRDLKPENILLDANGHIALCDFGLSKANLAENATTNTFCGTTEYLAPEVLLDEHGYTKMVDFWSLGVLVFEMCCGWSPFYAEDTQQMYKNIAFGKVRFPRDALSPEGRSFVKGLLNRNVKHRLGYHRDALELKEHEFFADVDWEALAKKNVTPPFKPKLKSELDTSNFDPEFTNALQDGSLNARAQALASGINPASTPLSPGIQEKFRGFTFVGESAMERQFRDRGEDLERMEEDDDDDEDADWEKDFDQKDRGNRMSGIVSSNDADDGIFNHNDLNDLN